MTQITPGSITIDDLRNQTSVLDIAESNRDDLRFFVSAAQTPFSLRNWNFRFERIGKEGIGKEGIGKEDQLFLAAAYRR